MTIDARSPGDALPASVFGQIKDNVNGSPNRTIITSDGSWSVPSGCHRFKVTLSGGGGKGGPATFDGADHPGVSGGNAPMVSKIITGQDIGASFLVTIGDAGSGSVLAGKSGGTTSFGALLSSEGGEYGGIGGNDGGYAGSPNMRFGPGMYMSASGVAWGSGGAGAIAGGGSADGPNGGPGVCIIEW